MLRQIFFSEFSCLLAVTLLSSVSVAVSSAESLSLSSHYRDIGLFSWRVQRTLNGRRLRSPLLPIYDLLFRHPIVGYLHAIRLVCCLVIPFCINERLLVAVACGIIATISLMVSVRGPDGKNGADQMAKITFVSLALSFSSPNILLWRCELVFLAGQLCLAYATSGYLRVRELAWRDGSAILLVLRQHTYGNEGCWKLARRFPAITRLGSISILVFECGFPLAFFLPGRLLVAFLLFGAAFHILNAMILGLNTFFWAYLALYPAFIWCAVHLNRYLVIRI